MADRENVLQEADRIIHGERRRDYGDVKESFESLARLWSVVLGVEVSSRQVCLCLIQLKVARMLNGWQRDSIVDIAGYTGLLAQIVETDV